MKKIKRFSLIIPIIAIMIFAFLLGFINSEKVEVEKENVSNNITTNNVIEQSKIIDMITDIETLSSAILNYEIQYDELPLKESSILKSNTLTKSLKDNKDDYESLKIIDLEKTKEFHTKLLLGYEGKQGDRYLYSTKTKIIYYEKGLDDGNGNINHTN